MATNSPVEVHTLASYRQKILLVFYDPKGYQFRVLNYKGEVFGRTKIFSSAFLAENEGRKWLRAN